METIITIRCDGERPAILTSQPEPNPTMKSRSVEAGLSLYSIGSDAGFAYIIKSGSIQLESDSFTRTIGEGSIFGEEALLGVPYVCTATALSECTLGVIGASDFCSKLAPLTKEVLLALAESSVNAMKERGVVQVSNLKERLVDMFNQMIALEGEDVGDGWYRVNRKPTHNAIAFAIGAQRSTVTVYMSKMRKGGVIRDEGDTIDIHKKRMEEYLAK